MKLTLLSVLLLAATTLHAQTAKVIQLNPEDAALAKSLHEQKEALDKKIADFDDGVRKHYLLETKKEGNILTFAFCSNGPCPTYKQGWSGGFEFSDDYKFIVPTPLRPAITYNTCPSYVYGGNTIIPATATFN
jgi:hypothetical protein